MEQIVDIPTSGRPQGFLPDRVVQRLLLRMLTFRLVEVLTIYEKDREKLSFLDLNTDMMLLSVHAEVEDLLEVLKAPSQDRAQQPEVEFVIASLLVVSSSCLDTEVAASSSPVRRPTSAESLVAGALRRRRVRDVLCPDGSGRLHGGLRHRGGGSGMRGLASPHPILGAISACSWLVAGILQFSLCSLLWLAGLRWFFVGMDLKSSHAARHLEWQWHVLGWYCW